MKFNEGDLVRHKAGGPEMVVYEDPTGGLSVIPITRCSWYDPESGEFKRQAVPTIALEAVT